MLDVLITNTSGGVDIGIEDGRLVPPGGTARRVIDVDGRLVTRGLVDCHTHLVFGGNRAAEWEMRLRGASYEEIARAGGGIRSTVAATRATSDEDLFAAAAARAAHLAEQGVTTIEIKSGYGLDLETELRMLRVAASIPEYVPVDVVTTYLGAHTVPPEFDGDADGYIDFVCNDVLPAVAAEELADAVDGFCESIAFTAAQIDRVFTKAKDLGLAVKLHADQLSDSGGAALAAKHHALSADHLEHASAKGIAAMAEAGTVAVLLPGATYVLREERTPPVDLLRAAGVPIAIASDCNPGTSPLLSPLLTMHLACTRLGLSITEAIDGMTHNAAFALGVDPDEADLVIWDVTSEAELVYWLGRTPEHTRVLGGEFV